MTLGGLRVRTGPESAQSFKARDEVEAECLWDDSTMWSSNPGLPQYKSKNLQNVHSRYDINRYEYGAAGGCERELDRIINVRMRMNQSIAADAGWRPGLASAASAPQLQQTVAVSSRAGKTKTRQGKCENDFAKDRSPSPRRDVALVYGLMLPRGRLAVQGVRALQDDRGVRASAGLPGGPTETSGQRGCSVERVESRAADGLRVRPDLGAPKFEHYTAFEPTLMHNNFNHGHPPVKGSGPLYDTARSPLQRPRELSTFERKAAAPGFTVHAALGGAKVSPWTRAHEALPDWPSALVASSRSSTISGLCHKR